MDKGQKRKEISSQQEAAFWINTMSGIYRSPFPSHGFFTPLKTKNRPSKDSDKVSHICTEKESKEVAEKKVKHTPVKLKNGAEHQKFIVMLLARTLFYLAQKEPLIFYELVQKCRDPDYQVWRDPLKRLKELKMIDINNNVHDITKDIILSSVTGEDEGMKIEDPVAAYRP